MNSHLIAMTIFRFAMTSGRSPMNSHLIAMTNRSCHHFTSNLHKKTATTCHLTALTVVISFNCHFQQGLRVSLEPVPRHFPLRSM